MLKALTLVAAATVGLAVVAALALPRLVDSQALRAWVGQAAGQAIGRPVAVASISIRPLPLPTVELRAIQVRDEAAFGGEPFLTVGTGQIALRLWPLLRGRLEARRLTLSDVMLDVVEDARGRLNIAGLGPAPPGTLAPARPGGARMPSGAGTGGTASRVEISDARVRYRRLGARPVEVRAGGISAAFVQDGPGGPIRATAEARLDLSGTRLALVDGVVQPAAGRPLAEWAVTGAIEIDARDAADALRQAFASPEVHGAVRGRFQVTGTLGRPRATGALTLERATLVEERPRCGETRQRRLILDDVRLPLTIALPVFEGAPVTARLAGGEVSLTLTVRVDGGPSVAIRDLRVRGVEASAILLDYLCQPWAVRGPLELTGDLALRGPDFGASAGGSGRLKIGRGKLTGRDVAGVVGEVQALTGAVAALAGTRRRPEAAALDFESITATYAIAAGVVRSDDLLYEARGFRLSGAGTYALADGRVAVDATFTQGDNRVRATIAGPPGALRVTATSIRIREGRDLKGLLDRLLR